MLAQERFRSAAVLSGLRVAPLRFLGAPWNRSCARRKARGRVGFRALREGGVRSPSMLAPARFRCRFVRGRALIFTQKGTLLTILPSLRGLRGTGPPLAGRLGEGGAFALCARDGLDRLQCLLRNDSAAASCGVAQPGAVVLGATLESRVDCGCLIWDEKDAQYRCRRCIP
jgi:hypothetical protein